MGKIIGKKRATKGRGDGSTMDQGFKGQRL